jgi:hypothetical protein
MDDDDDDDDSNMSYVGGLGGGRLGASYGRNEHRNADSSNTQYWLLLLSCAAICAHLIK